MVVFAQPCLLCLWCFLPKGFFRDRFPGSLRCRVCSQHISLPLSKPGSRVPPPQKHSQFGAAEASCPCRAPGCA